MKEKWRFFNKQKRTEFIAIRSFLQERLKPFRLKKINTNETSDLNKRMKGGTHTD